MKKIIASTNTRSIEDEIRWDLLDYIEERLENEIESNLAIVCYSEVPSYRQVDEVREMTDEDYRALDRARRAYIDVLIDQMMGPIDPSAR